MSKVEPNRRVAGSLAEALQARARLATSHELDTCSAIDCADQAVLDVAGVHLCDFHRRMLFAHFHTDYETGSVVYFAELLAPPPDDWRGGLVKIGTTFDLEPRMRSLRARAIVTQRGNLLTERGYHDLLAADRVRGEWFRRSPQLVQVMRAIDRSATQDWLTTRSA